MAQGEHYDLILTHYERHYYDDDSMAYRRRYIYPAMFHDLDSNGKRVLELDCGSGHNSLELLKLFPEANVCGLDISAKSVAQYRAQVDRPCFVSDLSAQNSELPEPADCAFVVGGLHHCVNDLPSMVACLKRLVHPGGKLIMVEPNADFFGNSIRNAWYRQDKWFREQEEAPLHHDHVLEMARGAFTCDEVRFLGGPAYLLVLNSLVTRVPHSLKKAMTRPLFIMDDLYNKLPWRSSFPMFIARWTRTNNP